MKALSIRQPWAWLITRGFKTVENRIWHTNFRGPVLIHAGKTMTLGDYEACCIFWQGLELAEADAHNLLGTFPRFESLKSQCGGIAGSAVLMDCVTKSESPWFVGPFGFVLADVRPVPFQPCKGELGFFEVPHALTSPVKNA